MNPESIDSSIMRLRVLAIDTVDEDWRKNRRLTKQEHLDLTAVLDELHRLHMAVSKQRSQLERKKMRPKSQSPRPKEARK
ncbi:MAG: hypothetical protein LAN18_10685 [Acidobacteriia bacterium]|nr:hypothetical protein [Terriglobia bacterium]